jgi:hypothetical protein
MSTFAASATDRVVLLTGRPPISEFLAFVQTKAIPGALIDRSQLACGWRSAHGHIQRLEQGDPYAPDDPEPVPATLLPLAQQLLSMPVVQRAFALLSRVRPGYP